MQLRADGEHPVAISDAARRSALGGVAGPSVFVAAWLVNGFIEPRYSMLHDPISDLAAVHAQTRVAMTAAFIVFAAGMFLYARAIRAAGGAAAAGAAVVSGIATLGVAAFPLHHSSTIDRVHGICAGTGYVALAAIALLSAYRLRHGGHPAPARFAAAAGIVSGTALAFTLLGSFGGLFQRVGLTAGDIWVVTSAIALGRNAGRPAPPVIAAPRRR